MPPSPRLSIRDALQRAVAHHKAGDLAEAEKLYRQILQAAPDQPDANHNLGTLARQRGNPADALPYLEAALRANPKSETYALSHAENLIACERPEEALTHLEAARRRGHDSPLLRSLVADARKTAAGIASLRTTTNDTQRRRISDLLREARFAEAETLLKDALAHQAEGGHLWRFYAIALALQDKDALPAFERAAALLPENAAARHDLARHLAKLGRLADAISHYRKAIELDPGQFEVHYALGNVLKDAGLRAEAEAAYRCTLALKPDCAEAWCNLSVLCKAQGRHAEAETCCSRTREINPRLASGLILAGDLAIDGGQFAEAEQLFKEAIALDSRAAEAWAGIPRTRKMTLQDQGWAHDAAAIADSGLAPRAESYLRFALGKYFDDTRQFAEAFPQFRRANDLHQQAWRQLGRIAYDAAAHSRFIDDLIAYFDHATITQQRFGHPSQRPVLVLGMPRSGTSLAEQILASHPDVHGAGELGHWGEAAKLYRDEVRSGKEAGALLPEIATRILRQLHALVPNAKRVIDKMPNNFQNIGLIHAVFPNARIIHMRRNPVDVCLSVYFNAFAETQRYASDLGQLVHYYREYERLMAHWRAVLPDGAMLDVPYEALVQDQEGWSRRMIEFIGLPWDERCLAFHENARAVRTPSTWQVRQKISTSSVERWRNYEPFLGPLAALLPPASRS